MLLSLWIGLANAWEVTSSPQVSSRLFASSTLYEIPRQSWETEEDNDQEMVKQHQAQQQKIRQIALYTLGAVGLGASGYGFYKRSNPYQYGYDEGKYAQYGALAFGGLAVGLGSIGGGVFLQAQPTSINLGFRW